MIFQGRIALALNLFAVTVAFAAPNLTVEIPGCHLDEDTESFKCDSGPLAGREFITRDEAAEALQQLRERERAREAEVIDAPTPTPPESKPSVEKETALKEKSQRLRLENQKVKKKN